MTLTYDAVVIGSGQGGNPLAYRLAREGHKVALVESRELGGTCVNTGCTPTKTMIASAQVAHYVREAARWSIGSSEPRIDWSGVLKRKDEVVHNSRHSWERKFENHATKGLDLYRERAHFTDMRTIAAGQHTLVGKRIFIDTGTRPDIPALRGIESVAYLTNESMLTLGEIPKHLVILGGGYVGLEFAQMFRRFGSLVTVVQKGPQILPQEDADVATELQRALEAEGIVIHLNAQAQSVSGGAHIEVEVETKTGPTNVEGSHLLLATGRKPNTEDLRLDRTGVKTDQRGFITVNGRLETTAENVWAMGDVTGGPAFTHIAYNDFQLTYANVYEGKDLSTSERLLPYAVYTDPELGRVGLTEKAARAKGKKLKIGVIPMTQVARALERAETRGCLKLVVDAESDMVLGATCLCPEGGELVQILSTLMLCGKPYTLLKGAIYIHPTMAEGFFSLMEAVKPVE